MIEQGDRVKHQGSVATVRQVFELDGQAVALVLFDGEMLPAPVLCDELEHWPLTGTDERIAELCALLTCPVCDVPGNPAFDELVGEARAELALLLKLAELEGAEGDDHADGYDGWLTPPEWK